MYSQEQPASSAAVQDKPRVGWGFIALHALAYTGTWLALLTPVLVSIALKVRQLAPQNATASLSLVLGLGAFFALVGNPLFGRLSDRTTSRFGMRRPWLIGGVICGALALLMIATATTVAMVLVGWCLAQLAFNAVLAAIIAVLPDQVPVEQRGTTLLLGQVIGEFPERRLGVVLESEQQALLVLEMPVDGAARHARGSGDLLKADIVIALVEEERFRSEQNLPSCFRGLRLGTPHIPAPPRPYTNIYRHMRCRSLTRSISSYAMLLSYWNPAISVPMREPCGSQGLAIAAMSSGPLALLRNKQEEPRSHASLPQTVPQRFRRYNARWQKRNGLPYRNPALRHAGPCKVQRVPVPRAR